MKYLSTLLLLYTLHLSSVSVSAQSSTIKKTCGEYKLTFYTHKNNRVYIAGREVSYRVFRGISSRMVRKNTCDDILFILKNEELGASVALSAIIERGEETYATSLFIRGNTTNSDGVSGLRYAHVRYAEQRGAKPLFAIGTDADFDPTMPINYSTWRPTMIVDSVLKDNFELYSDFRGEGAFPLQWSDGPMKIGDFGFKLCNPFAAASEDPQDVITSCFRS